MWPWRRRCGIPFVFPFVLNGNHQLSIVITFAVRKTTTSDPSLNLLLSQHLSNLSLLERTRLANLRETRSERTPKIMLASATFRSIPVSEKTSFRENTWNFTIVAALSVATVLRVIACAASCEIWVVNRE